MTLATLFLALGDQHQPDDLAELSILIAMITSKGLGRHRRRLHRSRRPSDRARLTDPINRHLVGIDKFMSGSARSPTSSAMALPASLSASRKTNSTRKNCTKRWRIRSNSAKPWSRGDHDRTRCVKGGNRFASRTSKLPITIYGIKNCDTMKKARAWLDSHGVAYGFHDYKSEGIAKEKLKRWSDELG
jgi:hypothetical protein